MVKSGDNFNENNREAAFAGKFYPKTKPELTRQLSDFFKKARKRSIKQEGLRALIVPHAGYVFSGQVAASGYNQIPVNANYKRIFVLASSHQYHFRGASVYNKGNYITPLGEVKVDVELANQLIDTSELFIEKTEAHQNEHSLEVQLPFLQYKLGDFVLVPIILGTNTAEDCEKIAEVLKPWFTFENLFIISTDFSHYPEYNEACETDNRTAQAICINNPQQLLRVLDETRKMKIENFSTSLCGWTSVTTMLYLTEKEKVSFSKIEYQNSGDSKLYGNKQGVVGYWSIAVFDEQEKPFTITENEKNELFKKAHLSISNYLKTGKKGKPLAPESQGILNEVAGVFVSIYTENKLRGCIGSFAKEKTLNDLVQDMAVSAACDHRFEGMNPEESDNLKIEISVLSPLKKISSTDEIELGKHGIYIKKGMDSGTFLPQVATKTGWNLNEFLGHCSRDKARLGWEGWKTAEIFTFEAIVFRET